jgi:hypothetical protein
MTIRRALLVAALGISATLAACARTPTGSDTPRQTPAGQAYDDAPADSTARGGEVSGSGY